MKKLHWLAGLLFLLTGCASSPLQSSVTLPLAQDRFTFIYFFTDG